MWEPYHSVSRENRLIKFLPCNAAMSLASAMFPNNHLGSKEQYILAVYAPTLDCRKNIGFTVKFHDFSLSSSRSHMYLPNLYLF